MSDRRSDFRDRWTDAVFSAIIVLTLFFVRGAGAQSIELQERDAVVWLQDQTVRGVAAETGTSGTLYVNGVEQPFAIEGGSFVADVTVGEGENVIVACSSGVCSDTLRWTLGYELEPELYAYATADGSTITLRSEVLEQPNGAPTSYLWSADPDNPAPLAISDASSATASVTIPEGAPIGEYYFSLSATDPAGREGRARTFVTADSSGVDPFDIWTDHAAWVDRAIVYEVTPYIFEANGKWRDVTDRLDEIAGLGVNTLWLQPAFKTHDRGQGYDITNYFEVRTDLGTEEDLRELVRTAQEEYGMKVLFDFVPNHTSIEHPYAQDVAAHGVESHYYDFYQTERDQALYSRHYQTDREPFIYYFWNRLVNIDYDNPEVYRWMAEAGQYWIEEFGIDGYRIDAVWGVNARTPDAMQRWRFDLKRLKPGIFLLGEDKATRPESFDRRFDAAYDWYPEEDWVSHWTWLTDYNEAGDLTIFDDAPEDSRSEELRDALTNEGRGWHPDAKVFRFLQNNDVIPFIASHGLAESETKSDTMRAVERTEMAATLLFALPGIPMIYNGQEIGHERHPYETFAIFSSGESIREQDPYGLYDLHAHLAWLRTNFPALTSDTFEELPVTPDNISGRAFAFRRWAGDEHVLAVINMGDEAVRARIELPVLEMDLPDTDRYYLTDLMTGEARTLSEAQVRFPVLNVPGYTTMVFALGDEAVSIPSDAAEPEVEVPAAYALHQNYPNPFNPVTTIAFDLPDAGPVSLRVFDLLGREVAELVNEVVPSGRHEVRFEGSSLASGVYVYRLRAGRQTLTRTMLLVK